MTTTASAHLQPVPDAAAAPGGCGPTTDTLRSVTTALDVLDCFAGTEDVGVSEVARTLGIAKSSAHRILSTLVSRGYAEQDPETSRYRLGLHVFELGSLARARHPLHTRARPALEELRAVTGWAVHLFVLDHTDVVCLDRLDTPDSRRLLAAARRRTPPCASAAGAAIAAFNSSLADAHRHRHLTVAPVDAVGTIDEFDALVEQARRLGVGAAHADPVPGLSCIAAPVRDVCGVAQAAIGVVAPSEALAGDVGRASRLVTTVATRLSRRGVAC